MYLLFSEFGLSHSFSKYESKEEVLMSWEELNDLSSQFHPALWTNLVSLENLVSHTIVPDKLVV